MDPYIYDKHGREHYEFALLIDGFPCEVCEARAVFHQCNAHGFPFTVHSHGGVHKLDGSRGPKFLCEEHGREVQRFNDNVIRQNKFLAKKGFI
jgi:hypothetical protein